MWPGVNATCHIPIGLAITAWRSTLWLRSCVGTNLCIAASSLIFARFAAETKAEIIHDRLRPVLAQLFNLSRQSHWSNDLAAAMATFTCGGGHGEWRWPSTAARTFYVQWLWPSTPTLT